MKTRTKVLCGTLFAVLVLASPLAAQARPWGHGPGGPGYHSGPGGPGYHSGPGWQQNLTPEKQQALVVLKQQHRDKMQPIMEQIWVKETTLDALSGNPNVNPKELTTLISEISALRTQAYAERKAHSERVKQEIGVDMPYGPGMGYGYHGNRGGGYHKGGFGRGCGW